MPDQNRSQHRSSRSLSVVLAVLASTLTPAAIVAQQVTTDQAAEASRASFRFRYGKLLGRGTITPTANPVVAAYSLTLPFNGTWSVSFGPTTSYGLNTGTVDARAGELVTILVAGMQADTTYHLRAKVRLAGLFDLTDIDHTFTTGSSPAGIPRKFPVTLGAVGIPQPGIELVNPVFGAMPSTALATDLDGNVIWSYPFADKTPGTLLYPFKQLDNGHFLALVSPLSYPLSGPGPLNALREFDLAGSTIRELTMTALNAALSSAGFNVTLENFSHDFTRLPNGHTLVLTNTAKDFTDLPGYPGTTKVVGDVVVDLDRNWKPVWLWNEFDHFDVNRHPWQFPDWTHSNSIAYSSTDGNFIVSMRHQNWIVKVNYQNGGGNGDVVWRLGQGGDFKLVGGTDPTDWFYAQHNAIFNSPGTAGVFSLNIMDNGDDRLFPPGVSCGEGDAPACTYTTIQTLLVDETAKTATLDFHDVLKPYLYSNFGGNAERLKNGNTEFGLSGVTTGSEIVEVTTDATASTVWQMTLPGSYAYRAQRVISLYPREFHGREGSF